MIPYKADVMMRRLPWANWSIMAVTVLVSLVVQFGLDSDTANNLALWAHNTDKQVTRIMGDVPEEFSEGALAALTRATANEGFSPFQLLSHAFVHDGVWHLFGNMLFLFVFGNAVNAKIGHLPYVILYVGVAILAGVAWLVFPGDALCAVGASGAVMGVAGAFAVIYPLNEISFFAMIWLTPTTFEVRSVWVLLLYFILDTLGFLGGGDGVSHISHMAGVVTGAAATVGLVLAGIAMPSAGEKTLPEILGVRVNRDEPYERAIELGGNRGPAMAVNPNAPKSLSQLRPRGPVPPRPPLN